MGLLQRIKDQGRVTDQGRMVEGKQDGLDWCLGEQGQPGYRCLGPSTVIVLFYAVGCIIFGFLVSLVVMQMDKSKAKKRKRSMDQNGANIESKVICVISNQVKDWDMFPVDSIVQIEDFLVGRWMR